MTDAVPPPATEYRFLDWRYEPDSRRLVGPGGERRLKPLPDRLLRHLLDQAGTVLAREQLIEQVWTRREVNDEVLSRAIAELRALLGDDARAPRFVETLSKGGYRWIAPVTRIGPVPPTGADVSARSASSGASRRIAIAVGILIALLGAAAWWHRTPVDDDDPAGIAVRLLEARPLTSDPRLEFDARFDASGRVVYVRSGAEGDANEIVLVDPKTLAERVLLQDMSAMRHPTPSPEGREVALTLHHDGHCEVWSVALVDDRRTRLAECAPTPTGGLEWIDGGNALLYTGTAADAAHAPGLHRLDRADGSDRVLTAPELVEGGHVDPRLSPDRTQLVYASKRDNEAQMWQADWPRLAHRTPLLKRQEPVFGHAFEADGEHLWIAGDLTLYRALHRLRRGGDAQLIGGRGALSIDIAASGAAVWSEANYDADVWLRTRADAPWTAIARSNRYESQPEFSPDGVHIALISNRNGAESVLVADRRDGSARPLTLDPRQRWVRPTWSARDGSLILTAYEGRHTRLYRYRLDGDVATPLPGIEADAFHGVELADRLVYLSGHASGLSTLMQWRTGQAQAEPIGIDSVTAYRASPDWLAWNVRGTSTLRVARWSSLQTVREVRYDDGSGGEAFALGGDTLTFVNDDALWSLALPDGEPVRIASERVPNGNGPSLATTADGALAVVTLTSLDIDLMIADKATAPSVAAAH